MRSRSSEVSRGFGPKGDVASGVASPSASSGWRLSGSCTGEAVAGSSASGGGGFPRSHGGVLPFAPSLEDSGRLSGSGAARGSGGTDRLSGSRGRAGPGSSLHNVSVIVHLLFLARLPHAEGPGGLLQLAKHGTVVRLQATSLGGGESLLGEGEGREVRERPADAEQALGEPRAERSERRGSATLGAHDGEGAAQELAALVGAGGGPQSAHEEERLPVREAVAVDGADDLELLRLFERGEREGERRAEAALVDPVLQSGGE